MSSTLWDLKVSQRCPFSPFLYVMVMSVLMSDAVASLAGEDQAALAERRLAELLYA